MIIKSSANLSNDYTTISNLAHEVHEPIYITQNGEGDLVVMSIEEFERREQLARLKASLDAAEKERLAGAPTYTVEEVWTELESVYNDET